MTFASVTERFPFLKWLLQARRIPLLFSVTIVSGIFYHYAPTLTVLWILLSLLLQTPLFRLFDYMKKHRLLGGLIYCVTGAVFLAASFLMIWLGNNAPVFAPDDQSLRLDFLIWFLTPQSVLVTNYLGYTLGLFLLFTFFIASVAYYFTLVRYRVLMSFVVMIFPFAIYAKENETMPIPSIIILLVCYFAVMVYCRQAHAEDPDVSQQYAPNAESRLKMPPKQSPYAKVKPEFLDAAFFRATGIFLAASIILVLVIPKPAVTADRAYLDNALNVSWLTDYLMDAIEGFTDTSDGGNYSEQTYSRALYHTRADENLNLRVRTLTDYHYDSDSWTASAYDMPPVQDSVDYYDMDGFRTVAHEPDAAKLSDLIRQTAKADPAFAAKWGLQRLTAEVPDLNSFYHRLTVEAASSNYNIYPAPTQVQQVTANLFRSPSNSGKYPIFQNQSEVLFSYRAAPGSRGEYSLSYLSPQFAETEAEKQLLTAFDLAQWEEFVPELLHAAENAGLDVQQARLARMSLYSAQEYADSVESHTPLQVRQLAESLTAGLDSDYEKAMAIRDHLRFSGEYLYSLTFPITDADNVQTFLFQNKTGVCYQFASAMAEMCRSVGLITRYVEGYSMSESDDRIVGGSEWDYVITTDHGHAFTEVYIPAYGWMMLDATAGNLLESGSSKNHVLASLQFSGLILFAAALLVLLLVFKLIPLLREKLFRSRFRKLRNAQAVQEAFARLRKQWQADPAETARVLCEKQSGFLGVDLADLLAGFEQTVYADRCDPETADRVYQAYCAAYDAFKPACKRQKKAEKAARKAAKQAAASNS